ncbi:MAG TPA: outer membrane protein assembly factor, partial [Alcanivorax sp.]|nr:outer membrane protein assembly factor [Alcanivorax sp.]
NEWALLAGVGVSTDTGPRLRLGVENRRVNAAGHTARVETELSSVRQGVGAGYTIPLRDPINEKIELRTRYVNEETDTSDSEIFSTSADYIIKLDSDWVATTSLEYLRETYTVADQLDQVELVIPGFQLSRVEYDDPIYP